jgi:hypothetical protein
VSFSQQEIKEKSVPSKYLFSNPDREIFSVIDMFEVFDCGFPIVPEGFSDEGVEMDLICELDSDFSKNIECGLYVPSEDGELTPLI